MIKTTKKNNKQRKLHKILLQSKYTIGDGEKER